MSQRLLLFVWGWGGGFARPRLLAVDAGMRARLASPIFFFSRVLCLSKNILVAGRQAASERLVTALSPDDCCVTRCSAWERTRAPAPCGDGGDGRSRVSSALSPPRGLLVRVGHSGVGHAPLELDVAGPARRRGLGASHLANRRVGGKGGRGEGRRTVDAQGTHTQRANQRSMQFPPLPSEQVTCSRSRQRQGGCTLD